MARERNKPEKSWVEITKEELANSEEFSIERAYEVGKIRGKKELIDKACKWWNKELREVNYGTYVEVVNAFRKAMED